MDEQQERELAQGLRQGRAECWRALYDRHAERVWRGVARLMGPSAADVADVVQETFLAAARSARSYDPARGSIELWLWGIARRHVALHYRRRQRQERWKELAGAANGQLRNWLEGRDETPLDALLAGELADLVRATLMELPADYELLLTGKYLDGLSVEQLAQRERSTPVAVRSKLARAREAFRQAFARYAEPAPDRPVRDRYEC